ncbi:GGDEF domain-containing protein [Thalassolituus sp. LLYu03]|uniref:GGDEF domain-containing protein n=1 Tax=Thalassolituus sp. LLYu03 TaxID=3421656 RepID=UPI003D2BDE7E
MPKVSSQQEQDTLKRVEDQINILSGILEQGRKQLRFPGRLESRYIAMRNQRFLEIDQKMLMGGLLFYLAFSWTDFYLGGDNGLLIFTARLILTVIAFALVLWVPRSRFSVKMVPIAASGVFFAGLSVIVFIGLIPGELKYAYHLGLIPIQIFTMVALRLSYRSVLVVSVSLLACYLLSLLVMDTQVESVQLNQVISIFVPMFIMFWVLLIAMGGYMAFMMESAFRSDFMKNQLLALEAERLKYLSARLHVLSTTDSLTGIANRRYLEQSIASEWRRGKRGEAPLSLAMIDIDRFKDYNDFYGHQQGDDCLRTISALMASFCKRPGDVCARYGGEEFVLLFPDTSNADALYLCERLRQAVEAQAVAHERNDSGVVTISIGVASLVPDDDNSSDDLLRAADRHLYEAKDKGRNQVCG